MEEGKEYKPIEAEEGGESAGEIIEVFDFKDLGSYLVELLNTGREEEVREIIASHGWDWTFMRKHGGISFMREGWKPICSCGNVMHQEGKSTLRSLTGKDGISYRYGRDNDETVISCSKCETVIGSGSDVGVKIGKKFHPAD